MKKTIKNIIAGLLIVPALVVGLTATPLFADNCVTGGVVDGVNCTNNNNTPDNLFGPDGMFTKIINAALFLIGAVSVLMLIYGGIRYTTSGGNATSVKAAKDTILYAIVGIVVALLAFAIVSWVVNTMVAK